jgi:hypothetical protein
MLVLQVPVAASDALYIPVLSATQHLNLTSSQVATSDWGAQEFVNKGCNVLRVVQVKVVSALDVMPLAPPHQIQSAHVHFLASVALHHASSSSDVQHPARDHRCARHKEVFCQCVNPARLQPRVTGQVISCANKGQISITAPYRESQLLQYLYVISCANKGQCYA